MINMQIIVESAVFTLGSITLPDKKIKSNNYQFLCVGRLINILVYFLLRHFNWIKRYSTMKIGRIFFVWVYIIDIILIFVFVLSCLYISIRCVCEQWMLCTGSHEFSLFVFVLRTVFMCTGQNVVLCIYAFSFHHENGVRCTVHRNSPFYKYIIRPYTDLLVFRVLKTMVIHDITDISQTLIIKSDFQYHQHDQRRMTKRHLLQLKLRLKI